MIVIDSNLRELIKFVEIMLTYLTHNMTDSEKSQQLQKQNNLCPLT